MIKPILLFVIVLIAPVMSAQAVKVELINDRGAWRLERGGERFFVRGVGTDRKLDLLEGLGANAVRTWGVGPETRAFLDEAHAKGLAVAVGIWLPHERQGFDYSDSAAVDALMQDVRDAVQTYKDHPAVLLWGIGNEMEGYAEEKPLIFQAVNRAAELAKSIDPDHPTMTVIAELGEDGYKARAIERYCPAIDIVGINVYGGVHDIGDRYLAAGGTRPYIITEHGPRGHWESEKTSWGLPIEATSTQKAALYRSGYAQAVLARPAVCLGSFAFLWGNKQEQTATWYGMLLPDNSRLECVDVMTELWTGRPPGNRVPRIEPVRIDRDPVLAPGGELRASVAVTDPEADPIDIQWVLREATTRLGVGGDPEQSMREVTDAVVSSSNGSAVVRMPDRPGPYRLFAYARDGHGGAAVANVPLLVRAADAAAASQDAEPLPFVVYHDGGDDGYYTPSGYMGSTDAIDMDPNHAGNPQSGERCTRVRYTRTGDWGGVAWQDPANDWGDAAGGFNLTGAATLSFYARGESGGEVVSFGYGLLGEDKPHPDSSRSELANVTLTQEWKQYTIDLAGKDLSRIKTGFYWTLAGGDLPVTFYLDEIVYAPADE